MELNGTFQYLAVESQQGKKDPSKTYYFVLLMQGAKTIRVMCEPGDFERLSKLQQLQLIDARLEYDDQYRNMRFAGFDKSA